MPQEVRPSGRNLLPVNTIPERELDLLTDCEGEARRLAEGGRVAAGFLILHRGFTRCAALLAGGSEWAMTLSLKYDEAQRRHMERYGARLLE
jgi:hypothetical protein